MAYCNDKKQLDEVIEMKKGLHGRGVFLKRDFKAGEAILMFKKGDYKRVNTRELLKMESKQQDFSQQVEEDLYVLSDINDLKIDDCINHSCEPKAMITADEDGERFYYRAYKDMKKGDELVWDYSTWMQEPVLDGKSIDWEIPSCACGAKTCRGRVRDFKYLSDELKKKYLKAGMVAPFIAKKYSELLKK